MNLERCPVAIRMVQAKRNVIPHFGITDALNECLCIIVVNSRACLHMPEADPPNVEGASETAHPTSELKRSRA